MENPAGTTEATESGEEVLQLPKVESKPEISASSSSSSISSDGDWVHPSPVPSPALGEQTSKTSGSEPEEATPPVEVEEEKKSFPVETVSDDGYVPKSTLEKLVLWSNPLHSGLVFSSGVLAYYLTHFAGYGLVTLVSYLLLLQIFANVALVVLHKPLSMVGLVDKDSDPRENSMAMLSSERFSEEKIQARLTAFVPVVASAIAGTVCYLKKVLGCRSVYRTTVTTVALFVLSYAGTLFSVWTLAFVAMLMAFTLPIGYVQNQQVVDKYVAQGTDKATDVFNAAYDQASQKYKEAVPPHIQERIRSFSQQLSSPKKAKSE
jgi:hypothetical protein